MGEDDFEILEDQNPFGDGHNFLTDPEYKEARVDVLMAPSVLWGRIQGNTGIRPQRMP